MRLIDADKIEFTANGCGHPNCKDICEYTKDSGECCGWLVAHKREVDKIPTIDAVPVIRCKECEYFVESAVSKTSFCKRQERMIRMGLDDFCSYGERRNDD